MTATVKDRIAAQFRRHEPEVLDLSRRIGAQPEPAFEEHKTAAAIIDLLRAHGGFAIEESVAGLDTAFTATAGRGSLVIGLCAELDALPGIGHGCGHNVIAASSVGAALALAAVADDLDLTVRLLGTPAEERGAGKAIMLREGAFDGLHAAMMVHPTLKDMATPHIRALRHWSITYHGRTGHASRPFDALNAADAVTIAQVAIGLLRQQIRDSDRVHTVIKEAGSAVNVIPGQAVVECVVRSDTLDQVDLLWARVRACFEAGALGAGARMEISEPLMSLNGFRHDSALAALFQTNAEALGRVFPDYPDRSLGSTDMAEVSVHMPAIHPVLSFDCPPEAGNHTAAFAAAACGPEGDRVVRDGGLALAWTVADAAHDDEVRRRLIDAGPFSWTGTTEGDR
ncbi:M20 family metallopeptidase [Amycolatopsis panacis]|uniref:Peptidase M20 domain-containing protein 2 n=1 Tax=Amycolatopsis panacis TaxID=2340917 RepID=A0A419I2D1_9PSEU|nr:M20 family metallopeptidase [Amycolatopsis panacis]RJQ84010.1 M20 family peptidase [Amycolatopsis panacis]